jgi:hypothetical protein
MSACCSAFPGPTYTRVMRELQPRAAAGAAAVPPRPVVAKPAAAAAARSRNHAPRASPARQIQHARAEANVSPVKRAIRAFTGARSTQLARLTDFLRVLSRLASRFCATLRASAPTSCATGQRRRVSDGRGAERRGVALARGARGRRRHRPDRSRSGRAVVPQEPR